MRNAVKRKTHKERSQPASRAKFGLLEKHKDYVLRARDFNLKKKRLQALAEKAAFRNPDEFYMKMQTTATKKGVHTNIGGDTLDNSTLALLRTQDIGYVSMKQKSEGNKIEKLNEQLHGISALAGLPRQNSHTLFFDSDDEEDMDDFDAATHFDTDPDLVGRAHNRQRREQLETEDPGKELPRRLRKKVDKAREAQYREVIQRVERKGKLDQAASGLQLQRDLMGKGKKFKVKGKDGDESGPTVYKWKQQRKK